MLIIGTITINLYEDIEDALGNGNLAFALDNHDKVIMLFYWDTAVYTFSVVIPFAKADGSGSSSLALHGFCVDCPTVFFPTADGEELCLDTSAHRH
jgi:hypothetical protein